MQRIALGTYGLEEAERIRDKFNAERDRIKERSEGRLKAHILFRGRGHRKLYRKERDQEGAITFRKVCQNIDEDLPIEYAQRVKLYLVINNKEGGNNESI